jgi:hypothetical protein
MSNRYVWAGRQARVHQWARRIGIVLLLTLMVLTAVGLLTLFLPMVF